MEKTKPYTIPVLLLVFNRADKAKQLLDALQPLQPKSLYIAADGPRAGKEGEAQQCEATRLVFNAIDWDCEVKTLYRDENLGCRNAVSGAIDWFFEQEKWGVILEDDCIPTTAFFDFAQQLLKRYEDDLEVAQISGFNPIKMPLDMETSYFFTSLPHIWGWATWANRWKAFDVHMNDFPIFQQSEAATTFLPDSGACAYLMQKWEQTYQKQNNSWAYAWFYHCVKKQLKGAMPKVNLIENIGFDEDSTHTSQGEWLARKTAADAYEKDLKHPEFLTTNPKVEMAVFHNSYKGPLLLMVRKVFPVKWVESIGRLLGRKY